VPPERKSPELPSVRTAPTRGTECEKERPHAGFIDDSWTSMGGGGLLISTSVSTDDDRTTASIRPRADRVFRVYTLFLVVRFISPTNSMITVPVKARPRVIPVVALPVARTGTRVDDESPSFSVYRIRRARTPHGYAGTHIRSSNRALTTSPGDRKPTLFSTLAPSLIIYYANMYIYIYIRRARI